MDVGFVGTTTLPDRDIVIPATATLKRFIVHRTRVNATSEFDHYSQVNALTMNMTVEIVAGQYSPRMLYRTSRHVTHEVTAFRDPIQILSYYSQFVNAGDLELGINQKVSYGTSDGPGFTIRLASSISAIGPFQGFPVGRAIVLFSTLHLLP